MTRDYFPDMPFLRQGHYVLKNRRIVVPGTFLEWVQFMDDNDARQIGKDSFVNVEPYLSRDLADLRSSNAAAKRLGMGFRHPEETATEILVSTIFLGLDHAGPGSNRPVLFETMVFNGPLAGHQERYCTYEDAEAGHKAVAERVKAALTEKVK